MQGLILSVSLASTLIFGQESSIDDLDVNALSLMVRGDYKAAEQLWLGNLGLLKRIPFPEAERIALTHDSLGVLYTITYRLQEAEDQFTAGLSSLKAFPNAGHINARLHFNFGNLLIRSGKFLAAEYHLRLALGYYLENKIVEQSIRCHESLGRLFLRAKKPSDAIDELARSIASRKEIGDTDSYPYFLDLKYLIQAYVYSSQMSQASGVLKLAEAIAHDSCYVNKAELYYEHGLLLLHEKKLSASKCLILKYLKFTRDPVQQSDAHELLGLLGQLEGNQTQGASHLIQALLLRATYLGIKHPLTNDSIRNILDLYIKNGKTKVSANVPQGIRGHCATRSSGKGEEM
jgi:hypothetical protein